MQSCRCRRTFLPVGRVFHLYRELCPTRPSGSARSRSLTPTSNSPQTAQCGTHINVQIVEPSVQIDDLSKQAVQAVWPGPGCSAFGAQVTRQDFTAHPVVSFVEIREGSVPVSPLILLRVISRLAGGLLPRRQ